MPNIEFNVDTIAKLAMLNLSDEERAMLSEQLPSIVAYISKLHEVDTSGVVAKAYLTEQINVFREDELVECDIDTRKRCVDAFPKKTGEALEVPGVFE
ncbi:MAG: Asp-tRNA(Asn)/Glu-tRNA(Gln) amidotransferase subunit GatC [Patescibacteria group bacterium]